MKSSPRAFTLIELTITIVILAVLTVALFSNFNRGILKARFDDTLSQVNDLIEEARGYSFTSVLVNDTEPTQYYVLSIETDHVQLEAFGASSSTILKEITLSPPFSIDTPQEIYYLPPNGTVCFQFIDFEGLDCDPSIDEIEFTLQENSSTYSQTISIDVYGAYPQLKD